MGVSPAPMAAEKHTGYPNATGQMARPGLSTEPQTILNEKAALPDCETAPQADARWQAGLSWQRILSYAGSVKKIYHDQPTVVKAFLTRLGELYEDFSLVGIMSFIRQTDKLFANDDDIFASLGDTLPPHPWILSEYHIALLRRRRNEAMVSNQGKAKSKRTPLKMKPNVGDNSRSSSTGLAMFGLTSGERRALLELAPLLATSSASLRRLVEDDMD
ncbi:hypothetical protein KC349_g8631 [Hortaea werneckii]|nr:hypothetical protein KC349_g8631 [Hortaea werneckii]